MLAATTYSVPGIERESHLIMKNRRPCQSPTPCRFVRTWQLASTGPAFTSKKEEKKKGPITRETGGPALLSAHLGPLAPCH